MPECRTGLPCARMASLPRLPARAFPALPPCRRPAFNRVEDDPRMPPRGGVRPLLCPGVLSGRLRYRPPSPWLPAASAARRLGGVFDGGHINDVVSGVSNVVTGD